MKEALYWRREEGGRVSCALCPHRCRPGEGQAGRCGVRRVVDGRLIAAGYGHISSAHVDPIEKKPLYHFRPGSAVFSIGGWGCNLTCRFCQNWTISQQARLDRRAVSPEAMVREAEASRAGALAYTYNEPLIGIEFVLDCARLARQKGIANVLVTNGYVNSGPAADLLPWIDALNVDLKSIDDAFYQAQCGGGLKPVQAFIRQAVEARRHVELTNLVIPGLNDEDEGFRRLAGWVASVGRGIPLHLSAYHPDHQMTAPPTPVRTLERAHAICREQLDYVYVGNAMTGKGQNTQCPGCGHCLVERQGFVARRTGLRGSRCGQCGRAADLVVD